MKLSYAFFLATLALLITSMSNAQDSSGPAEPTQSSVDHWSPFRALIGKWKGAKTGMGGDAIQTTEWNFVVGNKFIQCTSVAKSENDSHQDIGIISYDKRRQKFVYRAFYSEGYVNQYVGNISKDGKTIEFVTEVIENGPPGLRAKEVIKIEGDTIRTELHLASGDEPFKPCISAQLKKQE